MKILPPMKNAESAFSTTCESPSLFYSISMHFICKKIISLHRKHSHFMLSHSHFQGSKSVLQLKHSTLCTKGKEKQQLDCSILFFTSHFETACSFYALLLAGESEHACVCSSSSSKDAQLQL